MKPKVIIYDFDGVICDSVHVKTQAFVELYKDYGMDIQNKVKNYHIAHGGISRFEKIRYFQTELLNQVPDEETVSLMANRFADLVKEKVIASPYILGAKEFIEKNKNSSLQFICTGTPETEIIEIASRREIHNLFTGLYGAPKTKEFIINAILQETGAHGNECFFLGDALTDYNAAKSCNVPFIGVKSIDTIFPGGTFIIENFTDNTLKNIML